MKRVVLVVVAVLALGGLAFAAIQFFGGEDVEPVESAAPAPVFVTLEPFIVPVIREGRVVKQVNLTITLELAAPHVQTELAAKMPYLRDAFLTRLHGLMGRHRRDGRAFAPEVVKRRLLAESERVLGPGVVRDVLVQSALEQESPP